MLRAASGTRPCHEKSGEYCLNTASKIFVNNFKLTHLPLPIEGTAIDLNFFSSAEARQFITQVSREATQAAGSPEDQVGPLTWTTHGAPNPWPLVTAAEKTNQQEQHTMSTVLAHNFHAPTPITPRFLSSFVLCHSFSGLLKGFAT